MPQAYIIELVCHIWCAMRWSVFICE